MKRILNAYVNSIAGLWHGFKHETSIRQEIILLLIALPFAWGLATSAWHFLLLVGVVVFMLIVELLNTAVEALADKITLEQSEHIRIAKDCGSAAVMLSGFMAMAVWGITLWEYFF